jgi:hypothetical protein
MQQLPAQMSSSPCGTAEGLRSCSAARAERGEQRIQRQADIMAAIAAKLERYKNPWQELKLQYGANKGKAYTGARVSLMRCPACWCSALPYTSHGRVPPRLPCMLAAPHAWVKDKPA